MGFYTVAALIISIVVFINIHSQTIKNNQPFRFTQSLLLAVFLGAVWPITLIGLIHYWSENKYS